MPTPRPPACPGRPGAYTRSDRPRGPHRAGSCTDDRGLHSTRPCPSHRPATPRVTPPRPGRPRSGSTPRTPPCRRPWPPPLRSQPPSARCSSSTRPARPPPRPATARPDHRGRPCRGSTGRPAAPAPDTGTGTVCRAVRFVDSVTARSTERGPAHCPHPGEIGVVQKLSTGRQPGRGSYEVNRLGICAYRASTGCGPLGGMIKGVVAVHRPPTGIGRLSPASPHPCPLFGNATRPVTVPSESAHTLVPEGPVEKPGFPVGTAVENLGSPVGGLCRTLGCPQVPPFHPPLHPQARWTKSGA